MSALRQTAASLLRPLATSSSTTTITSLRPIAGFSTSTIRPTLKEGDKTDRDDLSEEYERHKQENLRNVKEGKAYWKQELASESESSVKADRGETEISFEDIKVLKEEAVKGEKKK